MSEEDAFSNEVKVRLAELGLVLPAELPPPAGAYEPFRLINGWGSLGAGRRRQLCRKHETELS